MLERIILVSCSLLFALCSFGQNDLRGSETNHTGYRILNTAFPTAISISPSIWRASLVRPNPMATAATLDRQDTLLFRDSIVIIPPVKHADWLVHEFNISILPLDSLELDGRSNPKMPSQ